MARGESLEEGAPPVPGEGGLAPPAPFSHARQSEPDFLDRNAPIRFYLFSAKREPSLGCGVVGGGGWGGGVGGLCLLAVRGRIR